MMTGTTNSKFLGREVRGSLSSVHYYFDSFFVCWLLTTSYCLVRITTINSYELLTMIVNFQGFLWIDLAYNGVIENWH